ncbi:MAG: class I SAM-dependent methyltransferase [Micropepsaceae bacterium]
MRLHRLRSFHEFELHAIRDDDTYKAELAALEALVPKTGKSFTIPGYSCTAQAHVNFRVIVSEEPKRYVNWRETVDCPITGFNNRMRSTIQLLDTEAGLYPSSRIYLTEQLTPMYAYLRKRFPLTIGSEFLGDGQTPGWVNPRGIRHEDLTQLSFEPESFDAVVSLDVMEHIPNFPDAFRETARVLVPGGKMIWSAPFVDLLPQNHIMARIVDGEIEYLTEPEYHGDPVTNEGVLCYTRFGWEVLQQAKQNGFRDAYALTFHAPEYGYVGARQYLFVCVK